MSHKSNLIAEDIHQYLKKQEEKSMLRFITCGSVDDGKSTLIGRLLWDSKLIFEDQLAALEADSKRVGTQGEDVDYALLLDGLQAEREQGITIDVAYRFFSTDKRKFIVADTPGHEQYTRNMVTGASTAEVAIILIDARKGVLTQTRRHSYLVSLVGIRHVVLAINKMDLVDYAASRFHTIREEYETFAAGLGFEDITAIPISAFKGDNVIEANGHTPWYQGPTLLEYLETVQVVDDAASRPFRMAVQWVNRPNLDFRGFSGTIASGTLRPGDEVVVPSSGQKSTVARIVTMDGDLSQAVAGQAVTLTLQDEIDISRGDLLSAPLARPIHTDQLRAHVVWMHEEPLLPGRGYLLKTGCTTVPAQISDLRRKVNVNTLQQEPGKTLGLNEVGVCNLSLGKAISFDPYKENRATGNFILIDRFSNATVGAGMIDFALRRADNIHWQALDIDKQARAEQKGQKPRVLWFTGLSGSGKSTIANLVEKKLHSMGKHSYILDGDNVRHGLNRDLGFTDADRVENIRRVAETARLFVDAGLIVLVSFISPFKSERQLARDLLEPGEFIEVYVNTPLEVCEQRDPKGLYKKARAGQLKNFTGIDSAYEAPEKPEIVVNGAEKSAEELAEKIVRELFG
ncbi:sulfate adenylyltransferase subunit CysN [Syntrophotalea acetylenica]|uniref:sulfate adenylyltransferase subunit CysN n=1 Tax=Syntrophotalea acetylenica TaxID=29542 RepID=UPI002A358577|nr:sulfate adenylyltransferase subunit CysN [Syntrophotalea acetylenica]MDY0263355.1 sulfate adenylyltransferase subunit CysN [Syntrophotalea acetylenica]